MTTYDNLEMTYLNEVHTQMNQGVIQTTGHWIQL